MSAGDKTCERCGTTFGCDRAAGKARCWCEDLPPSGLPPDPAKSCLCPACLRKECERPR